MTGSPRAYKTKRKPGHEGDEPTEPDGIPGFKRLGFLPG